MSTINTNIPSLVATRILNQQNRALSQSLERLSTGFRINRGADDPAGLIVSETLRQEQRAIQAAIGNASAADQIVSVAEGALNEVNSLLVELEGLLDKTANAAVLSKDEVRANQLQIDSILDSINRIANTTTFKGKNLLDGSLAYNLTGVTGSDIANARVNGAVLPAGSSLGVSVHVTASAQTAQLRHEAGADTLGGAVTVRISGEYGADTFSFASGVALTEVATAINGSKTLTGVSATVEGSGSTAALVLASTNYGSSKFVNVDTISGSFATVDADSNSVSRDEGRDVAATINGVTATGDGLTASVRTAALSVDLLLSEALGTLNGASASSFSITGGGAIFSLSPNIGGAGQVGLGLQAVHTSQLGDATIGFLSSLRGGGANDLESENFTEAQRIVRQASRDVSQTRGRLGAFQTFTLEPTIRSLQVAFENTAAAESAIRDTDFAEETSRLTRTQILVNAASIALQLANAAPQNVLSLLQ